MQYETQAHLNTLWSQFIMNALVLKGLWDQYAWSIIGGLTCTTLLGLISLNKGVYRIVLLPFGGIMMRAFSSLRRTITLKVFLYVYYTIGHG